MIPHQMFGQVPHTHASLDEVRACEVEWLGVRARFAAAFEVSA